MTRDNPTAYVFAAGSALSGRLRCLLESRGISITRSPLAHPVQRLRLLRSERITTVLDVGANIGEYGQSLRQTGYRGRIISYEPLRAAFARLSARVAGDPDWSCRPVALGAEAGTADLHVAADRVSSSLLAQLPSLAVAAPQARHADDERVTVVTLDDERDRWSADDRIFLKLDVQGYEAQVLHGAAKTLDAVRAIETELSFDALYDGQVLFHDQVEALRDLGFELVSLENVFVDQELPRLLQVDGLFARRRR
jgi:FkbM family methyltransferase